MPSPKEKARRLRAEFGVLRDRIESGGDFCGIESKRETPRHEGEALKNFEIGLRRDELREALDRDKQHDDPEDHRRQVENPFFLMTHAGTYLFKHCEPSCSASFWDQALVYILDQDRAAIGQFLGERRLHEIVEFAVEHVAGRA